MSSTNFVILLAAVLIIVCGQIMFKFAAQSIDLSAGMSIVEKVSANRMPIAIVMAAATLYALSTIAWVIALRDVPLSQAFMFNALAFVAVPVAGHFLFGEAVPKHFILGIIFIVTGLLLVTR